MKKQVKGIFVPLLIVAAFAVAGCASEAVSVLTPAANTEQKEAMSAVKVKCTSKASELMPKSLGFLEIIPPTTYAAVWNAYAACAREYGYEVQCQSSDKFLCGANIVGF